MRIRRDTRLVAAVCSALLMTRCDPGSSTDGGADSGLGVDAATDRTSTILDANRDAAADMSVEAGPDGTPVPCLFSDPVPPPDGLPCADPVQICDHNAICQPPPYATWSCICQNNYVWGDCMGPFAELCPDAGRD